MTERIDPVDYYDNQASSFATQASNEQANWFEYQENMPSLLRMAKPITGNTLDFGCGAGTLRHYYRQTIEQLRVVILPLTY